MYRQTAETEAGEWLDESVKPGRTYHYQLVAVGTDGASSPAMISVTVPQWRWQMVGWPRQGEVRQPPLRLAPTASPAPLDLTVISRAGYLDGSGRFHVIALLRNDHDVGLTNVSVGVALLRTAGDAEEVYETLADQPYTREVAAGETIPLHVTLTGSEPDGFRVVASGVPSPVAPFPLLVEASEGSATSDGLYLVAGRVRNASDARIDFPRVVVVLIDDSGRPVNAEAVHPVPAQIEPGSTATFQLRFAYFPRVVEHLVFTLR